MVNFKFKGKAPTFCECLKKKIKYVNLTFLKKYITLIIHIFYGVQLEFSYGLAELYILVL